MSAKQYPVDESAVIEAELAALEEVRDLMEDVDLTTPEGAAYARRLVKDRGLPEFLAYGAKRQPVTAADIQWAETRLSELRASGDVV